MSGGWVTSTRARKAAGCGGAIAFYLLAGCSGGGGSSEGGGGTTSTGPIEVDLQAAFDDIAFSRAVRLVQHPSVDDRWYVVEQGGEVHTFLESDAINTDSVAVDVDDFVGSLGAGNEQGLLGLAFDPDFDEVNGGEVYVSYTDDGNGDSVIARYESMDGGMTFAPTANPIVLAIPHPNSNHNGGDLLFGVNDDYLYYSMGDGGGADDPNDNGQKKTTLLGSVLRLDVRSTPSPGRTYAIPAGNPLCDLGFSQVMLDCPEIWAYGLRNPWRMGFDSMNGDLYLGDVGQSAREEVDRVVTGGNYGWDCREGDIAHATAAPCGGPFLEPEAVYDNPAAGGTPRSVVGGVVYRGSAIPALAGHYLYADFYTGEIWGLDAAAMDPPELLIDSNFNISSFAEGRDGEVFVVTYGSPSIYLLVPAPMP
jgi:glucose/arabinose dehydrogenase